MTDRQHTPFRLGNWLIEPDLNRVSSDSGSTQVEPRTMAVLIYLCQNADRVVSANEIINEVWGGRPMGDNPLYTSIAKLRRALGDDTSQPNFIATVPKKGYRLVAEVTDVVPPSTAPIIAMAPYLPRSLYIAAGLLVGLIIAGNLFWRPPAKPPGIELASTFPGSHSQAAFAPDGLGFAFVSDADGSEHIWAIDASSDHPRQLTSGATPDSRPRWAPNGVSILFQRDSNIWAVPATGGEPVELIRDAYHPNWALNGETIVFERRHAIWIADADGGNQRRVQGVQQRELPLAPRWPALSPDGSRIVYFDSDVTPFGDLWVIDTNGGEPERVTFDPAFGGVPTWTPDGKHIIYSSQRGGSRTLWRVNLGSKTSEPLLVGSGDDDFPDVSPDGKSVIFTNSRQRFVVVRSDPARGSAEELYESRHSLLGPELSPDKESLAFFGEARSGGIQLFRLPIAGGTPTMVTSDPLATHAIPHWSGDGADLYFFHTLQDSSFARVSADGGNAESVVDGWNWSVANGARMHPTQNKIIYSRLTGRVPVQTRIHDLDTGQDVSFYATLEYPRWSADGSRVLGALHTDQRFPGDIAICPVDGPKCRTLAKDARIPVWSADESQVYFVRGFGKTQELYSVPADGTGEEEQVITLTPLYPLGPFYSIAPDGSVIWIRYEEGRRELWVAEF